MSNGNWEPSGESVYMGDFSSFEVPGTYQVIVNERTSYPFEIKANLYQEAWYASIKSYYFLRASLLIKREFDSLFYRAPGHPDIQCFIILPLEKPVDSWLPRVGGTMPATMANM